MFGAGGAVTLRVKLVATLLGVPVTVMVEEPAAALVATVSVTVV